MAALEAPKKSIRWLHAPMTGVIRITVLSRGETWWSHWTRGGSKRCSEVGCRYCAAKDEPEPRYVYAVRDANGRAMMEFGSAQYGKLQYVEELGAVGVVLEVGRERPRRNSVLCVEIVGGEEGVEAEDVSAFARTLGI